MNLSNHMILSNGEENILPVLTNNMLVTESIPIWIRENYKKEYSFENLKNNKQIKYCFRLLKVTEFGRIAFKYFLRLVFGAIFVQY